jgi:hypothetical protein
MKPTVKEIFAKVAKGVGIITIAGDLNERLIPTKSSKNGVRKFWHSLTIRRMIKNSSFIGRTYFGVTSRLSSTKTILHPQDNWTLSESATRAIKSEELFNNANSHWREARQDLH